MHTESNRADLLLSSRQKTSAVPKPTDLHRQQSPWQNPLNQHLQTCNKTNNFIYLQNEHLHKKRREAHLRHQFLATFTHANYIAASAWFGQHSAADLSECSIRPVHETLGVAIWCHR
jgi:hypothetical protein